MTYLCKTNYLTLIVLTVSDNENVIEFWDFLYGDQPLSVLFSSLAVLDPRFGHTIYVISPFISILCHSDWLFPRVLSTTWCCLSRPCMVFLMCIHLALFFALFLSPGNSLVSSCCDHSMLACLLWQCLTVPSLLQLCWEPTHLFLLFTKPAEPFSVFSSQRPQDVFHHSFWVSSFHSRTWLQATLALSLALCSFKSVCCDALIACHLFNLVRNSVVHSPTSPSSVIRDPSYGNIFTCTNCSFWMSMRHHMPSLAITLVLLILMSRLYLQLTQSRRSTNSCSSASKVANLYHVIVIFKHSILGVGFNN